MGREADIRKVKEFKERLSKKMPLDMVILFGSRASGKPQKWSDFDVMIVSRKFEGVDTLKRPLGLHEIWGYDDPADFLCYSPQEFERFKTDISLVRDAVSNGIAV
jgi:hypothetical protein